LLFHAKAKKYMGMKINPSTCNLACIRRLVLNTPFFENPHHVTVQLRRITSYKLKKPNRLRAERNRKDISDNHPAAHGEIPFAPIFLEQSN